MPKTLTAEPDTSQQDKTKKQRKKQAKQEAKIMLKVEKAKKAVGKAQKKLTRAQSNLDESQANLQKFEEQLQQIRTPEEPQAQASQTPSDDSSETQPEASQSQEGLDALYQEPLLVSNNTDSSLPQADEEVIEAFYTATITPDDDVSNQEIILFTAPEEQPLTQADSDGSSYPSGEQNTPSPEAIAETDTTSPEDTTENGNSTLSPDEEQSLVEHGNEEPELSNNPNASSIEPEAQESNQEEKQTEPEAQESNQEENLQA